MCSYLVKVKSSPRRLRGRSNQKISRVFDPTILVTGGQRPWVETSCYCILSTLLTLSCVSDAVHDTVSLVFGGHGRLDIMYECCIHLLCLCSCTGKLSGTHTGKETPEQPVSLQVCTVCMSVIYRCYVYVYRRQILYLL